MSGGMMEAADSVNNREANRGLGQPIMYAAAIHEPRLHVMHCIWLMVMRGPGFSLLPVLSVAALAT